LTNTFSNLQNLGSDFTENPTPILSAIEANQLIYSNDLASGWETAGTNLVNDVQDFSTVISKAAGDLASGDFYDAETSISQYLTEAPLNVLRPLDNAFFEVAQSMTNNLDNVLSSSDTAYADSSDSILNSSVPQWFTELVQAQLLAPHAAELAFAGVGQDIVNALQDNDDTLAFNDLLNAPSTILDAYLNGYNLGDDGGGGMKELVTDITRIDSAQGLLSDEGAVETTREATETIAREISPARLAEGPAAATAGDAAGTASASADWSTVDADISSLLNPDTALGEIATAFDPNAVADITSLLTADLAPNASGWVVDLFSLF
jgi:hypothetical protein